MTAWVQGAWASLVGFQRDVLAEVATILRAFAVSGDWGLLAVFAPWALLVGAAHALTPGHSKTVLAVYLAGTGARLGTALKVAMALAATHVAVSVVVAVLALPVLSFRRGEMGQATSLDAASRVLLLGVGAWLVVTALRRRAAHRHRSGTAFALVSGLAPCPLTLLVMTFALARGVPEAGIAFAVAMLGGVGLVLVAVAALAVGAGRALAATAGGWVGHLEAASRVVLGLTGAVLVALSARVLAG